MTKANFLVVYLFFLRIFFKKNLEEEQQKKRIIKNCVIESPKKKVKEDRTHIAPEK